MSNGHLAQKLRDPECETAGQGLASRSPSAQFGEKHQPYFEEAVNQRNLDIINELVAEDGGGTCGGLASFRGHAGFRENAEQVLNAFPDFKITIEELVAEGDSVAIRWTGRGTHRGDSMGIAPTERVVPITTIE